MMQINVAFCNRPYMIIRWEVMQYKCWKQKSGWSLCMVSIFL